LPKIRRKESWDTNAQVVAGQRGSASDIVLFIAMEGEDAEGAADLRAAKGRGFFFTEGPEFTGAALGGGAGNLTWQAGCGCAGPFRIRENVKIGEGKRFDEGESCGMVAFGFAGEAGDDVGADGGVREVLVDELDAAGIVFGAVPAMHGREDAVDAGLQRHVEMLGHAFSSGEEMDEIARDVKGLDGADAKTLDRCFIENAAEQIFEFDAGKKIAAVSAEVDAAQNDLAVSRFAEALDFLDNGFRRQAPAFSADERDDAERATRVATILNFKRGARVIALPTEDRRGEKFSAFEDVADDNLAKLGRSGLRPYK